MREIFPNLFPIKAVLDPTRFSRLLSHMGMATPVLFWISPMFVIKNQLIRMSNVEGTRYYKTHQNWHQYFNTVMMA